MMKSVALFDSVQHDEEYILVNAVTESSVDDYRDDDDSYDYCDDVYSLQSAPPSFLQLQQQGIQEDFFEKEPHASLDDEDLLILLQGMALSSVIVEEQESQEFFQKTSSSELEETKEEEDILSDTQTHPEWNARLDVENSTAGEYYGVCAKQHNPSTASFEEEKTDDYYPFSLEEAAKQADYTFVPDADVEEVQVLPKDDRDDSTPSSFKTTDESSYLEEQSETSSIVSNGGGGRLSNKKRRKKMKLAKKAAASAAATASLSSVTPLPRAPTSTRTRAATKKNTRQVIKRNKKQIVSIAIACATEAIDSYKQEVRLTSKNIM
jgi:hypothetical protein